MARACTYWLPPPAKSTGDLKYRFAGKEKVLALGVYPEVGLAKARKKTAAELLDVLRIIEKRGALETVARVLQRCSAIFRYAIASKRAQSNPAFDLKGALNCRFGSTQNCRA